MKLSLTKNIPAVLPAASKGTGRYHASWGIKEVRGLEVCGASSPGTSGEKHDCWIVNKSMAVGLFLNRAQWSSSTDDDGRYDLAMRIFDKLQDQRFPTRREALQAVEMTLLMIEAEKGEGG